MIRSLVVLCWLLTAVAGAETLALPEVLKQVDRYHPKIRGADLNRQIAAARVTEKRGAFDPALEYYAVGQRYNSNPRGFAKDYFMTGISYGFLDRSGVKLAIGARNHQGDVKDPYATTGNVGEVFVDLKVPLLRGRGINEKSAAEDQALLGQELAELSYALTRLETLTGASLAYWEWVAAVRRLEVYRANLEIARERARLVAARVEAGDLPRIDSVEADQEVQRRLASLVEAERSVEKGALKLAFYLWRSDGAPARLPAPEDAPEELLVPRPIAEGELAQQELAALAMRPELKSLELEKGIVRVDYDLAANDRLPALDLSLSPGADTGAHSIGFTVKAGLVLTIPLGTRSADGRMEAAELKLDKLDLEQVETVQRILLEVRDVASQLRAVAARYQAAAAALDLARELERAERIRFELGDSTLFLVNQRERATAAAELELIDLLQDYALARTLFDAVAGKL